MRSLFCDKIASLLKVQSNINLPNINDDLNDPKYRFSEYRIGLCLANTLNGPGDEGSIYPWVIEFIQCSGSYIQRATIARGLAIPQTVKHRYFAYGSQSWTNWV